MKIKLIVCNCNGLKVMPDNTDLNTMLSELESDKDITWAVMHPQLCGEGGVLLLRDLLKTADPEDCFVVAGCGPENQPYFLGHVMDEAGFPPERFLSVNIRCCDSENARSSILEAVGNLMARKDAMAVDAFGG